MSIWLQLTLLVTIITAVLMYRAHYFPPLVVAGLIAALALWLAFVVRRGLRSPVV